ncbi:MAG: hypothetical protein K6G79_01925 [Bacteroidales bacterium]|nr:hypothetical protein [Bacteroidales bacterium]
MNLPTVIVLLIVAAALGLALWLNRRSGRRLTDCGCGGYGDDNPACRGCHGCDFLKDTRKPSCKSNDRGRSR